MFREIVTLRCGEAVLCSHPEKVSDEEVEAAAQRYKETGECTHEFMYDKPGWIYYERYCGVCHQLRALI